MSFESYSKDAHRKPGNCASEESSERLQARGKSVQVEGLVIWSVWWDGREERKQELWTPKRRTQREQWLSQDPQRAGHLQKLYHTSHIWALAVIKKLQWSESLPPGDCRRQEVPSAARIRMGTERSGKPGSGQFPTPFTLQSHSVTHLEALIVSSLWVSSTYVNLGLHLGPELHELC